MSDHPLDWTRTIFGSVLNQRKEAGYPNEELLAVTSSLGIVKRDTLERRDTSNEDKSKYLLVNEGDIAYNTMRMWQGVSGVSRFRGIVSPAYTICTPTERLDAGFAGYLLKDPEMVSIFRQRSQGLVSDTWNLKYESFAQIPCVIPPLPEQKKIAEILSGIDSQLAKDSQKLEKLFHLVQAITEAEVHLRSSEEPALPLSSLFSDKPSNGISPPETEDEDCITAPGIDCISKSGFNAKRLKKVQKPPDWERYVIKEGDFFITRANTPSLVGMCAVARGINQEMIYPDLMVRLQFTKAIHAPYLEAIFRSSFYRHIIQNSAQGTSQSMAKLNAQIISKIKVTIPGDSEISSFNKNIESVLSAIGTQMSKINRLQKLKSGLSNDLLSGRKRVVDARVLEGVGV